MMTESSTPTAPDTVETALESGEMRKIVTSAFIGQLVEYYDFILYATCASVVFNKVFFTNLGPEFGVFASFATFAIC